MKLEVAVVVILLFVQQLEGDTTQCGGIQNCNSCSVTGFGNHECSSCDSGYFLDWTRVWCKQCPSTCSSCDSSSHCTKCNPGYYGHNCSSACNGCKKGECDKDSGYCINGCEERYYQSSNGICSNCFANCQICYSYTNCSLCPAGFYGPQCNTSCPGCEDDMCDIHSGNCILGCKTGYFRENSTGHCMSCMTNCTTCANHDTCTACAEGFYLTAEFECKPCSEHCKTGTFCNSTDGYCEEGCEDMWSGEQCFDNCDSGCKHCSQYNTSSCGLCHDDRYGDSCEKNCSSKCKSHNSGQTCNKTNGFCSFGCDDGVWGETCAKSCGSGCTGGRCEITTGYCLQPCNSTYFGKICSEQCSENCFETANNSLIRVCFEENGHCINGCRPGSFGERCSKGCSNNCKDVDCFRNNGSCIHGCLEGYSGSRCDQMAQALRSKETGPNVAAIGGGVGGVFAILVVIGILVLVIIYRRRKTSSDAKDRGFPVTRTPSDAEDRELTMTWTKQADPGHELCYINKAYAVKEETDVPRARTVPCANAQMKTGEFDIIQDDEETIIGQAEHT